MDNYTRVRNQLNALLEGSLKKNELQDELARQLEDKEAARQKLADQVKILSNEIEKRIFLEDKV